MKKDLETKDDDLKSYKDDIKQWLKANKLKYSWIAANLGKSEGTVRNWLYNPSLKVAEENKTLIKALQRKHECGDSSLLYPHGKEAPELSYVFLSCDYTDQLTLWLLAAEVSQNDYDYELTKGMGILANWVTSTLNNEVRSILKANQDFIHKFDMPTIAKMISENTLSLNHFSVQKLMMGYRNGEIVGITPDEYKEYSNLFSLPVITKTWNNNHFALAVALKETTAYDFITETLTAAAQPDFMASLKAFIDDED